MKNVLKGLLPALMVSVILLSCNKEVVVISPNKTAEQQFAEPMAPPFHISKYRIYYDITRHGKGGRRYIGCVGWGGNCLKTVVIKGSKLASKLESGSAAISAYFSGSEWQEHFPPEVVADLDFVEFMQSGEINATKATIEGENGDEHYYISHSSNITDEDATYIIPIE